MPEERKPIHTDSLSVAGWKMAAGGALGGAVCGGVTAGLLALVAGGSAGVSCLIGAVAVTVALVGSQIVLILVEKLSPSITLLVALAVMGLAAFGLFVLLSWAKTSDLVNMKWVLAGVAVSSLGYLIGAKVAHSRVRLLHFSEQKSKE
ncbi:MAG: hypothetical protein FWG08_02955 [Propionibacteriaceae bacterium]|jgi:LytS/YehU family sensor histidine kinase|nr:hypothetical protein [Propionibacteriaceae bacterium]